MSTGSPTARRGHVFASVPGWKRSFALLSEAAADEVTRAVVFVHGYSGKARSTWTDFLSLVDDDRIAGLWWETSDLFFYDYFWRSMFRRVGENALDLFHFVHDVFPKPPQALFDGGGTSIRRDFSYRELTLVGHSEGGVLIRKIILHAADRNAPLVAWRRTPEASRPAVLPKPDGILVANVRLFAPALGGEALAGMMGVIASLPIISSALHASAAKLDLAPGATAITSARRYTDEWSKAVDLECFKAHIVWAAHDFVVDPEKYLDDLQCTRSPKGTDHASVCKPTRQYPFPVTFVERGVEYDKC
ncbi:MAG TPA: hypothetical protein VF283_03805 [Bryobacteraceae bacterium]